MSAIDAVGGSSYRHVSAMNMVAVDATRIREAKHASGYGQSVSTSPSRYFNDRRFCLLLTKRTLQLRRHAWQRAHQTRNARIVPPKTNNASPHKEKVIARSIA